jgi:cupin fold WbuC family metalloprotein
LHRLRLFHAASLEEALTASRGSARRRANFNVHPTLDDAIQRMLNIFQPGSYVRPHRHDPERFELFLRLTGEAGAVIFDDAGRPSEWAVLGERGEWGVEAPGDAWHTIFALAADTVMFEVKPGPYRPLVEKDFAPWAPREGTPDAAERLKSWVLTVRTRSLSLVNNESENSEGAGWQGSRAKSPQA